MVCSWRRRSASSGRWRLHGHEWLFQLLARIDDAQRFVAGVVQFDRTPFSVPLAAEKIGRMQHVDVWNVALDRFAAIAQPAQCAQRPQSRLRRAHSPWHARSSSHRRPDRCRRCTRQYPVLRRKHAHAGTLRRSAAARKILARRRPPCCRARPHRSPFPPPCARESGP
jgi:hypothetical protein